MKKITIILSVFIFSLSISSYGQETIPLNQGQEQLDRRDGTKEVQRTNKATRKRAHKRAKQRHRANKRQVRAMRRVAKADGNISPKERAVIRSEKRKMKRKGKRRAIKRRQNKVQGPPRINRG
ncbi:MAG: hypothetical protein P1U56_15745 [Saprospiraceae bacterium]|nr:hypothetical protein [Saprospiraceae bacterium]